MSDNKHTKEDLHIMQSWSLERKIMVTQTRIMEWYQHFDGQVYVSFSGGKDSTVLLDLARRIYPDMEVVFVDTGLEYPEIRDFVKTFDNVTWLRPEKTFNKVIEEYGYPALSKTISHSVSIAKRHPNGAVRKNIFDPNKRGQYALYKWSFLFDAPFDISDKCCDIIKKKPIKKYSKITGNKPILGIMACESKMRTDKWLQNGCNAFDTGDPKCQPMSFWTEQDVLKYLKQFKILYSKMYGDIVPWSDPKSKIENYKYKTTGEHRTGCMFCMFGVHLEKEPNRFQRMKETHPKQYDYCINKLGCGKVLDYKGIRLYRS